MTDTSANNKRIAKNTLLLYFRMLFMMAVSLFTSRVVLDKLGITDYGIYNVVGGVVAMLGFLNGAMSNAVHRFLQIEMGRGDQESVNHIFNVSIVVHCVIALIVLVVMEFAGVWYLNTYINIPIERMDAAKWVLQCSIFTTVFSIVQTPYNAIIVSKEQMGVYAYISILEVSLKLGVVYMLGLGTFDRLKLYSVLMMLCTIGILTVYCVYCKKKYVEARFRFVKDFTAFKKMASFAGWNMVGEIAWAFTGQGVNIILNLFFGPIVNAARGVADQVNGAVSRFVSNFQTAITPQLIKTYAQDELDEMKHLLYRGIRFSYYLLLVLSLPLILNMEFLLHLWLKEVPPYTTGFCQLVLICSLVSSASNLLAQVARAYGKIRKYQLLVSAFLFLNFPLSYFVLWLGASPLSTMIVNICIQALLLFVRLYLTKSMISFSVLDFVRKVLFPIFKVTVLSGVIPCMCMLSGYEGLLGGVIVVTIISLASTIACVSVFGMSSNERAYVKSAIQKVMKNLFHKK